jgi:hypothetical protein
MKKSSLFLFAVFFTVASVAQSTIELLGPAGSGGPSGTGPTTVSPTVTFYSSTSTAFAPLVKATYSLSNQQFTSIEGNAGSPGAQFGGGISSAVNSPIPGSNIYDFMNALGSSVNANYTSCNSCTPGTGIDVAANQSVQLTCYADALINSSGTQLYAINARVQYADLTITFNRPVSNPLLHITGLGGFVSYGTTISGNAINYDMGFSTDMDLLTNGLTLSKISGNSSLSVTSSGISNSSARMGSSTVGAVLHGITRTAASGTVAVLGTNITTITFRLYLRGDGGIVVDNSGNTVAATNGNIVRWSFHSGFIPGGSVTAMANISGDGFLIGMSLAQPVAVSGNVFNDPDGGNVNNSTGAANSVPSGLYANLIDAGGKIVESVPVGTNGVYNFPAIFTGTYSVNISTAQGTQGALAAAPVIPAGWNFTGEYIGTPNTGNTGNATGTSHTFTVAAADITNVNFGVQRAPETAVNVQLLLANPGNFINKAVPASAFQTSTASGAANTLDYDGGTVTKIHITAFPAACNSITLNGITYTNGTTCPPATSCQTWPAAGVTVAYNNGTGPVNPVLVDPVDGTANVIITFAAIDNSGAEDPTPGSVTIPFATILAVQLNTFTAQAAAHNILLKWKMENEISIDHYDVQYSNDGVSFSSINTIVANKSAIYTAQHQNPSNGYNYYRLKIVEQDGAVTYTGIEKVYYGAHQNIVVYPVPAKNTVTISFGQGATVKDTYIQLLSEEGKLLIRKKADLLAQNQTIDVSKLVQGKYILQIISNNDITSRLIEVIH